MGDPAATSGGSQEPVAPQMPMANLLTMTEKIGVLADTPTFSIRNGNLADVRTLLIKATISKMYHWVPIRGMPPRLAVANTAAYIRCALAMLTTESPGIANDALRKKIAIILGVTRAVCTQHYELTEEDIVVGERALPMLEAVTGTVGNVTTVSGFRFLPVVTDAMRAVLEKDLELTPDEVNVMAAIHSCAVGVPVLQGYSLIMTTHHYLSDAGSQSRRAYDVVERTYWRNSNVSAWFDTNTQELQDAMWHKAGHPISMKLKVQWAYSKKIASMLKDAQLGAVVSRLPATESELRAANSYKTCLQTVRPMFELCGAIVSLATLEEAMTMVGLYPHDEGEEHVIPRSAMPVSIPPWVKSRKTAIEHLRLVTEGNADIVAYAYGFYCALSDATGTMLGGASADSLKNSNSLRKLEKQSKASYTAGQVAYGDYVVVKNAKREKGEVQIINLQIYSPYKQEMIEAAWAESEREGARVPAVEGPAGGNM